MLGPVEAKSGEVSRMRYVAMEACGGTNSQFTAQNTATREDIGSFIAAIIRLSSRNSLRSLTGLCLMNWIFI